MEPIHKTDTRESFLGREPFGTVAGKQVYLFSLKNSSGMVVQTTNYGATVTSIQLPDGQGGLIDVALGFGSLDSYLRDNHKLGATVGRYCNRIGNGSFVLDGKHFVLERNDGLHCLHSGSNGFDRQVWDFRHDDPAGEAIVFSYLSRDGEGGFPGNLSIQVEYRLTSANQLKISYLGRSDALTVCNLTHHSYFNLSGESSGNILECTLQVNAGAMTPIDDQRIPTGEIAPVGGSLFDFRSPACISDRIEKSDPQLDKGYGFDHNWVLDTPGFLWDSIPAAIVSDPRAGRTLKVYTSEPGIQIYTGNHLNSSIIGKSNTPYTRFSGICLEPQHFPDSPNKPQFPSTRLEPGREYHSFTIYEFC